MNPEPPFFLVWREGGDAPVKQHRNVTAAENEAERLAIAHPGSTFYVLIPSCRVVERRVTLERFDVFADEMPF